MTPKDHNMHHALGLKNANFAAVFTFWDRIGRTLDRKRTPPWWGKASWKPRGSSTRTEAEQALAEADGIDADDRTDRRSGV